MSLRLWMYYPRWWIWNPNFSLSYRLQISTSPLAPPLGELALSLCDNDWEGSMQYNLAPAIRASANLLRIILWNRYKIDNPYSPLSRLRRQLPQRGSQVVCAKLNWAIILFLDKIVWNNFIAGWISCTAYGGKNSITRHFLAAKPPCRLQAA